MARLLSFKKVDAFFKDLATKHVDIQDYCSTSVQELADKISSVDGLQSVILVFYDYFSKLSGVEQRTFNSRSLAFSILINGIKSDDYPGQREAIELSEEIGLEVLSRINVWSKMPESGWLYNNFDKNSVTYNEIDNEGTGGFYGMEFHFDLKTLEPLVVTPEKWNDGAIFCEK